MKKSTRATQKRLEGVEGMETPAGGFSYVTDPASPRLESLAETVLQEFLERGMIELKHLKALERSKFKTQLSHWLLAHLTYAYDVTQLEEGRKAQEVRHGKAG